MNDLAELNSFIVDKVLDARRDPARMQDLIACLVAGIGLAVAVTADGRTRLANDLCEMAGISLFEASASQAARLTADGERA